MLKLSEIGKLSQQFTKTCCYKNLQSHILAAKKCCPNGSSASAARSTNEPIRIKQRAGLCQLGRNDIRCCPKCNEIEQCIWCASKNSSFFVPDQATPWYEKQRDNRLNRHTLLEKCQCYGISSFVPPEECLKWRARACLKPLDPNKFKRISPEFLNLLQNYEYLMAKYDPRHDRSGYCRRPAKVFLAPSEAAQARGHNEGKDVRHAAASKIGIQKPEMLITGRPKAHGFERPSREVVQGAKKAVAENSKKIESGKSSTRPSQLSTPSAAAGTSKAAKQGKNEKKRWSLLSKENKKENNSNSKTKSKSGKNQATVREIWSRPKAEMRESGGSIEVSRGKSRQDTRDADSVKLRPQIRYREYPISHEVSEQSRVRSSSTLKYRSVSDREPQSGSSLSIKPRVHAIFDITETAAEKNRSCSKTSRWKWLWSSPSASTDREPVAEKKRSHSLHSNKAVTELNPSIHGYSKYKNVEHYRSSPSKPRRKQSCSPSKCRVPSDRDDDSDFSFAPRVHKQHKLNYAPTKYAISRKRTVPSPSPTLGKSCKRSGSRRETHTPLAPRLHAYKDNKRYTKHNRERSLSTAAESSSCGRRKNVKAYRSQVTHKRLSLATTRGGRAHKKVASTSASTDSIAPRLHGYRRHRTMANNREKYAYPASRKQLRPSPSPICRSRIERRRTASRSDSLASINAPQVHGYRYEQPTKRPSFLKPPSSKKSQRYETAPKKMQPEDTSLASKSRSPVNLRPGLHGYRNHALAIDEETETPSKKSATPNKNKRRSKLPSSSTSTKNQQELPQQSAQKQQQQYLSSGQLSQAKRKSPKHTTVAAFTTHIHYNHPDKQDLYNEGNKCASAKSSGSLQRSQGSSSPLTSDSSLCDSPKFKNSMVISNRSRCSNCKARKEHCFCDPSQNDPRFLQLQKIHHYQDTLPEKPCEQLNSRPEKNLNSSSIFRKCFGQKEQSDTGLSSECEERVTRFSEISSNNMSRQSCGLTNEQARACALSNKKQQARVCPLPNQKQQARVCPSSNQKQQARVCPSSNQKQQARVCPSSCQKQQARVCPSSNQKQARVCPSSNQIQIGYMSDLSKFNGVSWQDGQMEPDGGKSSQARENYLSKNTHRGDTSPNPRRHANCYKDSMNWTYADEQFPLRYRQQGETTMEEAYQLGQHRARNRTKSRICITESEDEENEGVSVDRHKACSKDAHDWSEATKNYPIRYQQAAKDAAAQRAWRAKHREKTHSMSPVSSEAEDRHTLCSRDAHDWTDVTENYPVRYREAAAQQEADREMLRRHAARRRSRSPSPIPGVCPERHKACFDDSMDWQNATMNYPIRYRIAALEAASGRKFHTRHNIWGLRRDQSPSPNSSPSRSPNRNAAPSTTPDHRQRLRSPYRNESPTTNRSRAQISSSQRKVNAEDRGYDSYLHRQHPTQHQTQQQSTSCKKSRPNCDDNEPPQPRLKVSAAGYYKSPSYLNDPSQSRIPIAKQSQKKAASRTRTASTTGKENKPTTKKLRTEKMCSGLRPDYILGQRQSFRS